MSLKQIADELGLSLTTVSRALNGYPEVAQATRVAVREAAERLNYQPDARARGLALGRADAVGLVFPFTPGDLGDMHFLTVASSMSSRFAEAGLDLFMISASPDEELTAYRRTVTGRRVDAFVVPRTQVEDERLALLQQRGIPFVAYGRSDNFAGDYAWLDFDNVAGARMAAERLVGFGHRAIGYLGAPPSYNFAAQRFEGFSAALERAGIAVDPTVVRREALDRRSGFAAMQALLASPAAPTAVLVDNHLAGIGAVFAILEAGLEMGRDLSVVIYDGLGPDTVIRQSVTSVEQPNPEMVGNTLASLLLGRLKGEAPGTLQRLCTPVLAPGESDGPVRRKPRSC